MKYLKCLMLSTAEKLGVFRITARLFQRKLIILCYHGFEARDECSFRPQLFIRRQTFEDRLDYLRDQGFNVIGLDEAVTQLRDGTLSPRSVVITIDDGFASTFDVASPALRRHGFPASVYVTTYYVEQRTPVFRLAVQYLCWLAGPSRVASCDYRPLEDVWRVETDDATPDALMWSLIRRGESMATEDDRANLLARFGELLGLETQDLLKSRILSLMSPDEVAGMSKSGISIELHTHRHRFPREDESMARWEIEQNRASLERMTGKAPRHFCYPSGIFSPSQWPLLEALGVESATTCIPGLNDGRTPRFALRRFLDSEDISPVEFRAEVHGMNELLRRIRALLGRQDAPDVDYVA